MALLLCLCLSTVLAVLAGAAIAASPLGVLLRFAFGSWAERCRTGRPTLS